MKLFEELNFLLEAKDPSEIAAIIFKLAEERSKGSPVANIRQLEHILSGVQNIVQQKIDKLGREL